MNFLKNLKSKTSLLSTIKFNFATRMKYKPKKNSDIIDLHYKVKKMPNFTNSPIQAKKSLELVQYKTPAKVKQLMYF